MRRITLIVAVVATFALASFAHAQRPRQALNMVMPDLNFSGVALADAIDFIRDVSGANIHVNWPALEAIGVGRDTTINLRLRNIPMRQVLRLVLREAGAGDLLTYVIDDGVIQITTKELADEQMFTRVYPVDDLIMEVPDFVGPNFNIGTSGGAGGGGGQMWDSTSGENVGMTRAERAAALVDMIQAIIEPDVWDINGGRAAIRFFQGSLIVTAPRSVHEALGGPID